MTDYTDDLRRFWSMPSFEQARDERVTVPAAPEAYNDSHQDRALTEVLGGIRIFPGQTILDYGCGVGRVSRAVLLRQARVVAADVSPKMLEYSRQYCEGLTGLETYLTDGFGCADLPATSVDGAISLYCFQHMPTLAMVEAVARDIHRLLVPGGWFVFQFTDHGQDQTDGSVGFTGVRLTAEITLPLVENVGFALLGMTHSDSLPRQYVVRLARRA